MPAETPEDVKALFLEPGTNMATVNDGEARSPLMSGALKRKADAIDVGDLGSVE